VDKEFEKPSRTSELFQAGSLDVALQGESPTWSDSHKQWGTFFKNGSENIIPTRYGRSLIKLFIYLSGRLQALLQARIFI
jgi:hypothetical protein